MKDGEDEDRRGGGRNEGKKEERMGGTEEWRDRGKDKILIGRREVERYYE